MKIHEYQAKEVLRKFGVITPRGIACFRVEEAVDAARKLGGSAWVVKAQIHASGGGMDIEAVAEKSPEKIHKVSIGDPFSGLADRDAEEIARKIGVPAQAVPQTRELLKALYEAFD